MKISRAASMALGLLAIISSVALAQKPAPRLYCTGVNSAIEVEVTQSKGKLILVVDGKRERVTLEAFPGSYFFDGKKSRLSVFTEKNKQGKHDGLIIIGESEEPDQLSCEGTF